MKIGVITLLFVFVSVISAVTYQSNWKTVQETEVYYEHSCSNYACGYTCHYSWWWWWWWWWPYNCYYRTYCSSCTVVRKERSVPKQRCADSWTGPACNIPICNPSCNDGKTCTPGNKCECVTVGEAKCKAEACSSPPRSCYPGTCASNACACPPEFNGTNCQSILQTPSIDNCLVKLFTGTQEQEVASANCAVEGRDPEITWVAKGTLSRIEAGWEAKYLNPYEPVLPTDTVHIKDARFGVTESRATVQLNLPSSSIPIERYITCKIQGTKPSPVSYVDCQRRSVEYRDFGQRSLPANSTVMVIVSSRLGGFKTLRPDTDETIAGLSTSERRALFKVDPTAPEHCRQKTNCTDPVIAVKSDAIQNPVVDFEFQSWFDHESGIKSYDVAIYELLRSSSSGETLLIRPQTPKIKNSVKGDVNKWQYTFPSPGVYALELTVLDNANNPSKARKIMFYDNENHMQIREEYPFIIEQASKESGYRWITDTLREDGGLSRLKLSWKARYSNMKHLNEGWLSRVPAWDAGVGIDDDSKDLGGKRTIHKIDNANGTAFYRLAFKVDKQGGFDLRPRNFTQGVNLSNADPLPQSTWMALTSSATEKEIVMPALTADDTVVIWMEAYDAVGFHKEDLILVRFDVSEPELYSDTPAVLKQNTPDKYTSSIEIRAKDMQSGIAEVRYYIFDASIDKNVTSGIVKATKLGRSGVERRRRSLAVCKPNKDTFCYCINGGECFENEIIVKIDHCLIDKYYADDKILQFHYIVINQAGKSVKPRTPLILKFEGGNPLCRPVTIFTAGTILAILIGMLVLIVLVVLVVFMILRWKQDKHPIPDRVRTLATSMRQRITNKEQVLDSEGHVIYRSKTRHGRGGVTEDDDDIYVDGSDPGGWRIGRDQVELAETLAEGKFAIVKKGYMKKGGESKPVAVKFLPSGASEADKALLKAKIAFHGNRVPPHDNIVRLIGVLDEGPSMLLEFCDMTLKDWLSKATKVNTDVLENMLNFTMHIASGMDHLHSKSIVHRRLAIRNVLVKKDGMNGLVAKLIGFGTFNEVGSDDGAAAEASVAVPLKWLAPETLESVGKGKAVYTQKSDVWAYGVTVWEIYSLGATPYAGKKSAEVEALLKTGHRMTKPDECPPELFDGVVTPCWNAAAKKRPDFKSICKQIKAFRSGGDTQEGYYAVDAKSRTYDDPKERTTAYKSSNRAPENSYHVQDELYDDTRK